MRFIIHRVTQDSAGGPTLDMTPDGEFRAPPEPTFSQKVLRVAIVVAVLAAGLAVAALAPNPPAARDSSWRREMGVEQISIITLCRLALSLVLVF